MPQASVIEKAPSFATLENIVALKKNWLVSVGVLIVRMKQLCILTEWQYRTLMIEMSKAGFRKTEPNSFERERSLVLEKVLPKLEEQGYSIHKIASALCLPLDEVASLLFKVSIATSNKTPVKSEKTSPPKLVLVKS